MQDAVAHGFGWYAVNSLVDMLIEALDAFPGIARGSQGGLLISSCLNHDVEELEISELVEEIKVSLVVLEVRGDQVVLISLEIKFQDLRDRPGGGCQVERRRQPGLTHDERSQGFQQVFQHGFHTVRGRAHGSAGAGCAADRILPCCE